MRKHASTKATSSVGKKSKSTSKKETRKDSVEQLNRDLARRQPLSVTSSQNIRYGTSLEFHPDVLADMAYVGLSRKLASNSEHIDAAWRAGLELLTEMRPKDALERLTLTQIMMAQARTAYLSNLLARQTEAPQLGVISEAAEKAASSFTRLVRAFGEYRQPRSSSATVSIGQANVAGQQVVQNVMKQAAFPKENDDEQTKIHSNEGATAAKTLPAHAAGIAGASSGHQQNPTVDDEQRAQKPGRQSQGRDERIEARRTISRDGRTAKAGPADH